MKKCLLIVLVLVLKMSEAQVTNYQINKNTSNNVIPYKIYNSNDGNLLLSNVEPNWDVGSNHVLKVKPNGDTIFIKSTDAEQLFVTSTGNIITNATVFQILYQNYTNSSINFYDKNYNIKWSLDLSSNLQQLAPWQVWGIRSPPIVSNFFEITPNQIK